MSFWPLAARTYLSMQAAYFTITTANCEPDSSWAITVRSPDVAQDPGEVRLKGVEEGVRTRTWAARSSCLILLLFLAPGCASLRSLPRERRPSERRPSKRRPYERRPRERRPPAYLACARSALRSLCTFLWSLCFFVVIVGVFS